MPIIKDRYGIEKYKPSLYVKEELPTWNEVYNEWFKQSILIYDVNDEYQQELDPYWKIPRRKYLIAVVCNQFNKMLFEDGMYSGLLDRYREIVNNFDKNGYIGEVVDIRFTCESMPIRPVDSFSNPKNELLYTLRKKAFHDKYSTGLPDIIPPIYTIEFPSGKNNPFIVTSHRRISVSTLKSIAIYIIISCKLKNGDMYYMMATPYENIIPKTVMIYTDVMEYMLKPFMNYFENGVGWKDENGELIGQIKDPYIGYDPAL